MAIIRSFQANFERVASKFMEKCGADLGCREQFQQTLFDLYSTVRDYSPPETESAKKSFENYFQALLLTIKRQQCKL